MINVAELLTDTEDRINFLKGLIRISKSDGLVDPVEYQSFMQISNSFNLSEDIVRSIENYWTMDEKPEITFSSHKVALFFIMQAIQLCWYDGDYSREEIDEIHLISSSVGVSLESLRKIESWVQEGIEWNRRGELLLEDNEG